MTDLYNLMKEHHKHTLRRVMSKLDIRRTLKDSQATTLLALQVGHWRFWLLVLQVLVIGTASCRPA
jgi:hypothetical protein